MTFMSGISEIFVLAKRKSAGSGRKKNSKNLKRVDGGLQNQHGIIFTDAEKRALESAVNSANRKRRRLLQQEGSIFLRDSKGRKTQHTVGQQIGKESNFILAPKTKSLQRFKSKEQFENYLANLRHVNERGYIDNRTEQYRQNYFTALDNAFGDEAADIKAKLESMSLKEYREFVASADDVLEIGYIYLSSTRTIKLNAIRSMLGLDTVEVPDDDEQLDLKRRTTRKRKKK